MMQEVVVNLKAFVKADGVLRFDATADDDDLEILEAVFRALNEPEGRGFGNLGQSAIAAYHRQYPSLSVGDEVVIGGRAWVCRPVGWAQADVQRPLVDALALAKERLHDYFLSDAFAAFDETDDFEAAQDYVDDGGEDGGSFD